MRKYVTELVERGLIQTERTTIITQDGRKQNGSLLYTLLPIQFSIQQFYEQKLAKLDAECEQERIRKRLEAFQQAQQKNAVRPREPRVAAVSVFPDTAGRRYPPKEKNGCCAAVREQEKFDRSPAQRVRSKEETPRNGRDLPLAAWRGIWSAWRRSRRKA